MNIRHWGNITSSIPWLPDRLDETGGRRGRRGHEEQDGASHLEGLESQDGQRRLERLEGAGDQNRLNCLEELGDTSSLEGLEVTGDQNFPHGPEETVSLRHTGGLEATDGQEGLQAREELGGPSHLEGLERGEGQGRLEGLKATGARSGPHGTVEPGGRSRLEGLEASGSERRSGGRESTTGRLEGLEASRSQRRCGGRGSTTGRLEGIEASGSQRRSGGRDSTTGRGGSHQVGDWIADPPTQTGDSPVWVYLILALNKCTAEVLEFKKSSPAGRIKPTSNQAQIMPTSNKWQVRVLVQENPKAHLKVARDPPAPGKKNQLFWIFESGFIQDLPWDPGEWRWQAQPPMGDAPFFGYTTKRGYNSICHRTQKSSMTLFLEELQLRNSLIAQLTARIWHSSRPRKVGTLIWLTLNKGLPVGTWLRTMGLPSHCKVCNGNIVETPQHCLMECPKAQRAWEAFQRIWSEWHAPNDLNVTWSFVLLGEAAMERDDDPPELLAYHAGGFTYPRQPLDILRSFIVYALWTKRCRMHFDSQYSLHSVLTRAWVATVEVGMATWKAIKSQRGNPNPDKQSSIEFQFRQEWLHRGIMGSGDATIRWHFLPPLYLLNLLNE